MLDQYPNASLHTAFDLLETGIVTGFCGPSNLNERLSEIGIFKGLLIHRVGQSPFGGPILYRTETTVIALREEEAKCILVRP
jgi:ferrous iron transport protein A